MAMLIMFYFCSLLSIIPSLNGKISDSALSNSDRCTCQTLEIGTETKSLMPSTGRQCSLQCRCYSHDWCCVNYFDTSIFPVLVAANAFVSNFSSWSRSLFINRKMFRQQLSTRQIRKQNFSYSLFVTRGNLLLYPNHPTNGFTKYSGATISGSTKRSIM